MYRKCGCIVKKHRFYKEKLKFYIENEVFYRRKQYYGPKISGCIIKKDRFYKEKLKFYIKTRFSLKKIVLCIENPVVQLIKTFLQGRTEILQRKRGFLQEKIVLCIENPFVQLKKHRFYKERLKFYIENEVFYRRKQYYVSKISGCIIKKDRFYKERLKFYIQTRFSI